MGTSHAIPNGNERGREMTVIAYSASVFSEETQQEVKIIAYEGDYATIEVPPNELMFTREQLRKLGHACLAIADTMGRR